MMAVTITIGILGEGTSDISSLRIICSRLISQQNINAKIIDELSKPAYGPISEKVIKIRTALFKTSDVGLAFYFADADKLGFNEKLQLIRKYIQNFDATWLDRSIIGIPDRNLEAWLLSDQNIVKRLLNLDASKPLPHEGTKDPKERLFRLVSEYGDDALTPATFRLQLAKQANLETIAKQNNSFRAFHDELFNKIANYKN